MDIGYARIATTKQNLARQLDALAVAAEGSENQRIYVDKKSGRPRTGQEFRKPCARRLQGSPRQAGPPHQSRLVVTSVDACLEGCTRASGEYLPGRKELEQQISDYGRGGGVLVSVSMAAAHHDELRALPMSDLQRADLEDALKICTDPVHEREFFEEVQDETKLLRDRHRRVRNAVNHGLPLS